MADMKGEQRIIFVISLISIITAVWMNFKWLAWSYLCYHSTTILCSVLKTVALGGPFWRKLMLQMQPLDGGATPDPEPDVMEEERRGTGINESCAIKKNLHNNTDRSGLILMVIHR